MLQGTNCPSIRPNPTKLYYVHLTKPELAEQSEPALGSGRWSIA